MTKKKAKRKPAKTTKATKSSGRRGKRELNPTEVRKGISRMVESHANKMTKAVIDEGEKGQLATVKYLFEMAAIFPASTDGSHATEDEDCLARTLLNRLDLPTEPVGRDDEDEPLKVSKPAMAAGKDTSQKESDKQNTEQKEFEPAAGTDGGDRTNVSLGGGNDAVE
jgi:hypothetical protein